MIFLNPNTGMCMDLRNFQKLIFWGMCYILQGNMTQNWFPEKKSSFQSTMKRGVCGKQRVQKCMLKSGNKTKKYGARTNGEEMQKSPLSCFYKLFLSSLPSTDTTAIKIFLKKNEARG